MGNRIVLFLIIPLLFSCAARKVAVTKTQTQTYIDSSSISRQDSVSIQQNAIVITNSSEEIEISPIDTAKPVIIGQIKYYNAKLKIKKVRKRIVDSTTILVSKSNEQQVLVKKEVKQKVFDKKIDKKVNYAILIWFILILLLAYLAYRVFLK